MTQWVQCVPNFSEARRPHVMAEIRDSIAAVPRVYILDVSSDSWHNRSVITFIASVETAAAAAFAGVATALKLIDLNSHSGVHPRIGATDVVPFVPVLDSTMEQCVSLARELGERVGRELALPVYLYENAATRPERVNLANIRRGGLDAIRAALNAGMSNDPDFGPRLLHPTGGAIAIGARRLLVAYNVYLGDKSRFPVARNVARAVRESDGGLPAIKALPLVVDGQAQVSMNLVDLDKTSIHDAFDAVRKAAAREGVEPVWSEIVGLVPRNALTTAAAKELRLLRFSESQVLEDRIAAMLPEFRSVGGILDSLAAPTVSPAGGMATALSGALAASLVEMLAVLASRRSGDQSLREELGAAADEAARLRADLLALGEQDSLAYAEFSRALKEEQHATAGTASTNAPLSRAARAAIAAPLAVARASRRVADLALLASRYCAAGALPDAAVAAMLADAACRGSLYNVRANMAYLADHSQAMALESEAESLAEHTGEVALSLRRGVEKM
jgi:glutamate formiminotransferase/formiminotetrahydrofolate cyclodeaminase